MSEMNYADWLKAQFTIYKDRSKADLARELGLEPPAISKILNGARQVKAREYAIMRSFFGLPATGANMRTAGYNPSHSTEIKQPAYLSDITYDNEPQDDWIMPLNILGGHTAEKGSLVGCTVSDSFMEPHYSRNEIVIADTSDKAPSPPGVFVVSDKFSSMIRHCEIIPHSNPAEIKITANDPGFQKQVLKLSDFEIVGRVVAKLDWVK